LLWFLSVLSAAIRVIIVLVFLRRGSGDIKDVLLVITCRYAQMSLLLLLLLLLLLQVGLLVVLIFTGILECFAGFVIPTR